VVCWLVLYVAAFTGVHYLSLASGNLHNDTLEAYAWGKELQLGYSKHPPFWAWVAYAWFTVFPTTDWSAYLLCSLNGGIGLWCSWLIARRYLPRDRALASLLCLMITTSYICFVQRFNANTILVSLWPATTLAVLRAVEHDRLRDGAVAGLLAGLCLLSKYQSVLFLLTLLVAVYFLENSARSYFSRSALTCYAVAAIVASPNILWLQHNDYLPLQYMRVTTARPWSTSLRESIVFILVASAFIAPAVIAYVWAGGRHWRGLVPALIGGFRGKGLPLAILTLGPPALTIAVCLLRSSTVRSTYAIPMFFVLPAWIAMAPSLPFDALALRRLRGIAAAVIFICLVASPVFGYANFVANSRLVTRPKDDVVDAVTTAWHQRFGKPLRIVAGDQDYAISAPFYSTDHPSYLIGFDRRDLAEFAIPMSHGPIDFVPRLSPWVNMAAIERDGLAIICSREAWLSSTGCREEAALWIRNRGMHFEADVAERDFLLPGPVYKFDIYFVPPLH
jgi:4-amino-4-deoxy-L-arabinose transferase-like glycosyltransferase